MFVSFVSSKVNKQETKIKKIKTKKNKLFRTNLSSKRANLGENLQLPSITLRFLFGYVIRDENILTEGGVEDEGRKS